MRKAYDLAYWDAAKMGDAVDHARGLRVGRPESIRMSNLDYADLLKFSRNVIDINTRAGDLRIGYMGSIYGISIFLEKTATQGVVSLLDPDLTFLSHVVNPRRWSDKFLEEGHSLSFHSGAFPYCSDGLCLSMLVMGS